MSKKTLLVIDANHAAHRSAHTLTHLSWKGKATNVTFGILNILFASCGVYKPKKVIMCWDDGRHPGRTAILPTYKNRDPKINFNYEDFHRQNEVTRRIIKSLGIPQLHRRENEADDYIYRLVRKYRKKGWKVVIVSGDKDFNQLVENKVFIHNPGKCLITPLNFKKVVGVETPEQFVDYLSLIGDSSDKIPGVRGIGEVTALKFLKEHGSISNYINKGPKGTEDKLYDKIQEGTGVSKPLIDLKWFYERVMKKAKLTEEDYYKGKKRPKQNLERYKDLCARLVGITKFSKPEHFKSLPNG